MAAKTPEKKDAGQVIAAVRRLWDSAPMAAYRSAIPQYRAAIMLRLDNDLPDSFARGDRAPTPTTRAMRTMRILKTDAAGFPRYTDVVARSPRTGVPTMALQSKADSLGRRLTMLNATLDENHKVTDPTRDHQLADGGCVWVLHRRKAPGGGFSWEIEVADQMTCAYHEQKGGAFQPKALGRRYQQSIRWLKETYDNKGRNKGQELQYAQGKVDWVALGSARSEWDGPANTGSTTTDGETREQEVDVVTYDDGCWCYHVIVNKDGKNGQMLYCERNSTYRPTKGDEEPEYAAAAIVVAGDTFAIGADGELRLPVLMALINIVAARNLLREVRMIGALRDRPDMVATGKFTAEEMEILEARGAARPGIEDDTGGAGVIYVGGDRAVPWTIAANEDLDKIAAELKQEEDECVAEMIVNTNPDVVAQSTAQSYFTSTSSTQKQKTNWLQNTDAAWVISDRLMCNASVNDDEEYSFTAVAEMNLSNGETIAQGESADLTPDDVDFDFEIAVATKEETEEQKSRQMLNLLYLYDRGVITFDQVLEGYVADVAAQEKKLAIGAGQMVAKPVLLNVYLPQMIQQRVMLRAGYWVPLAPGAFAEPGGAPPGGGAPGGGTEAPPGGATYQPAAMEGASGGSTNAA